MSTTTAQTNARPMAKGIFNAKAETFSASTLRGISQDMMRVLFYNRIAQTELSFVGKSELLSDELRKGIHATADALRQFDMRTRGRLESSDSKWLSAELSKDKLLDMGQVLDLMAHISNDGTESDYEDFLSMVTNFMDKTLHLQARKNKLNMKKYKALLRFMTEEMIADVENGQTAVHYDAVSDSLSFRLVQPDAQVPAKVASN